MSDTPNTRESLFSKASAAYTQLTARERRLVSLLAAVASALMLLGVGFLVSKSLSARKARLAMRNSEIVQIESLRDKYEEAVDAEKKSSSKVRSNTASLYATVTKAASELGLSVTGMSEEKHLPLKDTDLEERQVEATVKELSVDKLSALIEKIEGRRSDGVVKVTKLKTKPAFGAPDMLELQMTVSTWKASATAPAAGGEAKP